MATYKNYLISLSSDRGERGTSYFAGFLLEVHDCLQAKINEAWDLLAADPMLSHIGINVYGLALPGLDNDNDTISEAMGEKLAEMIDGIDDDEACELVGARKLAFLQKCSARGASGETLVVHRYTAPTLRIHDKWDYEQFSSACIKKLIPAGLKKRDDENRRKFQRELRRKERESQPAANGP